ncbi:hypothetical protein O0L34_g19065 [Tuta absoluta]|nr:hypothetical protein O0L34_g19065 [Tuta absoluta]
MKCALCLGHIGRNEEIQCLQCRYVVHYKCLGMTIQQYTANNYEMKKTYLCEPCNNGRHQRPDETQKPDYSLPNQTLPPNLNESDMSYEDIAPQINYPSGGGSAAGEGTLAAGIPSESLVPELNEMTATDFRGFIVSCFDRSNNHMKLHIDTAVSDLKTEVSQVIRSVTEQVTSLETNVESLDSRVGKLEFANSTLEVNFNALKENTEISELKKEVSTLRNTLNERDQQMMLNDIDISGIPELPNESLRHIITSVALKLGVSLDDRDVISVMRAGRARAVGSESGEDQQRPRVIVVRMASRALRDKLLSEARMRKVISTEGIGLPLDVKSTIYLNEHLTTANRILLGKVRVAKRQLGWRFVWSKEGRIYARESDSPSSTTHRVHSEED